MFWSRERNEVSDWRERWWLDPWGGGGQVGLCMRETEQMKMRRRAQLYANFMTLPWGITVTLIYHLTVSLFVSNISGSPPDPTLLSSVALLAQFSFCRLSITSYHSPYLSVRGPSTLPYSGNERTTSIHHTVQVPLLQASVAAPHWLAVWETTYCILSYISVLTYII